MQFREQGKKIQCIRSIYDPLSKHSHQKVIFAFSRDADSFPGADLLTDLSDEERMEFDKWWMERQTRKTADIRRWRRQSAGTTLSDLAEAIKTSPEMTSEEADNAWNGLVAVAKALRKSGHPKPKRRPPISGKKTHQ
jgi:hypothetical protein